MNLDFTKRLEEVANSHTEDFIKICAEREIFTAFAKLEMTLHNYGPNSSNVDSLKDELCHLFDLVGMECEARQDFRYYAKKVKDFEAEYKSYGAKSIEEEFNNRALLSIYGLCREHFTPEDYMFRIVNSLEKEDSKWVGDSLRVRILKKFIKNGNFMEYKYENPKAKKGFSTKKLVGGKKFIKSYVKNKIGKTPDLSEILNNIDDAIYEPYEKNLKEANEKYAKVWKDELQRQLEPFLIYLVKDYADKYFVAEMESSLRIEFDVERRNLIEEIEKIKKIEACDSMDSNKLKKLDEVLKCLDECKSEFLVTNDYKSLANVLKRYCKDYLDEYYVFELNELKDESNKKAKIESRYNNKKNALKKYINFLNLMDSILAIKNLESYKAYTGERDVFINLHRNLVNEYNKQIKNSSLQSKQYGEVKSVHTLYKLTEICLLQRKVAYESLRSVLVSELKKYYDNAAKIDTYLGGILDNIEAIKTEYEKNCLNGNCYTAKILALETYRDIYLKDRYEKNLKISNTGKNVLRTNYYKTLEKIQGYINILNIRATIPLAFDENSIFVNVDDEYVKVMALLDGLKGIDEYLDTVRNKIIERYKSKLSTFKHDILNWFEEINDFEGLCEIINKAEVQNSIFNKALVITISDSTEVFNSAVDYEKIVQNEEFKNNTDKLLEEFFESDKEESIHRIIREELLRKINEDLRDKKEILISEFLELYSTIINSEASNLENLCYEYLYSVSKREINKCNKCLKNFVEFVNDLTGVKGDVIKEEIIKTFNCETNIAFKGTIKLLKEYINKRYVDLNRLDKRANNFDKVRSIYYKEKAKIEKYIYAFHNMKYVQSIEEIINKINKLEQNLKSQEKSINSLTGQYGLLKLADDLAFGKFRGNGYTRQVLYWTAMIYGMKYKQYLDMKHSIDSNYNNEIKPIEDFEKSLFRDYYVDNWIRRITDAYSNNVNAFDYKLTEQGINYKNFVEFIMIYYIVKEGYTPEEKIKLSDEMVNQIIVKHKERKVTDIKSIEDSTMIFKEYHKKNIFDYDEKDFEKFILDESGFKLNIDKDNESVYQIATNQNSAVSEYETILKDIVDAYTMLDPISYRGKDITTVMYDKDFYKANCSYGLQFAESFNIAEGSRDNLNRSNFIARIEAYERQHKFFNENSPLYDDEISEKAKKFFYLIDKIHQYLKNVLSTLIKTPEDMSRNRLLAAIYYSYNIQMRKSGLEYLSLTDIYKEMREYDGVLEECNYAKLSSKNIVDVLIVLSTYMRLNKELNEEVNEGR